MTVLLGRSISKGVYADLSLYPCHPGVLVLPPTVLVLEDG